MAAETQEILASGQTEQLAGASAEAPRTVGKEAALPVDLPAFLKEGEVPEGYKIVELGPEESLLISVGLTPGSEAICYAGNVGVKLTRGDTENIHFSLLGFDFPRDIFSDRFPFDSIFTDLGPEGIPLGFKARGVHLSEGGDVLEAVGFQSLVLVKVPSQIQLGGRTAGTVVLSGLSTILGLGFDLKIGGKSVRIRINSQAYGIRQKVVVPTAAVKGAADEAATEGKRQEA